MTELIKSNKRADKSEKQETHGMDYLQTLPRRWVTIYIPLGILVFILLFPFYWMAMTAIKPNSEMLLSSGNPFWVIAPTLQHFKDLLFNTPFTEWLVNTVIISVVATRSEEHTSELQSLMRISYAVFCLKKKRKQI